MDISLQGLVIGETKLGDNKKYIKVLTDSIGSISVIVHGANGHKSRNLAAVRPFTYSSFVLNQKKDSYTLKEASVIKSFFMLGSEPKVLALASYIISVAGYVSSQGEDTEKLLSLTLNSLYALNDLKKTCELTKAVFELKCAAVIGFAPALVACSVCASQIVCGATLYVNDGDILCEKCKSRRNTNEYQKTYVLTDAVISAMRYIVYSDIKKVFSFTLAEDEEKLLCDVCEKYLMAHIEATFPALGVYKSL